ncbi:MAG: PAS domain S-box protein [Syntrophaceae bacterium]|nr:PAS domain S-box protein [Syntrophaceae bacterium]
MTDSEKTKEQLMEELGELRRRLSAVDAARSYSPVQAEDMIADVLEQYRGLLDKANEGFFILQDGKFVFVNQRMAEILGSTVSELEGFPFNGNVWPEDREYVVATYWKRVKGEDVPALYEFRVIGAGGKPVWTYLSATARLQWKGKPATVYLLTDISERKRAEEALRQSESRYRTIFENTGTAIIVVEDDTTISFANTEFEKLSGYARHEIEGRKSWTEFVIPQHLERMIAQHRLRRVDGGASQKYYEFRFIDKDGGIKDIALSVDVIPGTKTSIASLLNITDRKQAEEALRKSEERFRALSENAPDIIYTMDLTGAITYANPSWKFVLGHDPEEIIGRYFTEFTREEDQKAYRRLFKSLRDEMQTVTNHIGVMLTRDGRERVFNMNSAFNRDSDGCVTGVIGTLKDVTEGMEIEKKLNQAQRMEAIGTLAGGIAHDFNNLLMGIQGYASLMLLDLEPSHPHYERVRRIEEQVKSGTDLTRQLLGLARGGRYEVKPSDMNDIVNKTSDMFGRTKKEISIYRKYAEDLWSVEVDRGQMDQVFMNLYVNAWQAMPGGGEIFLETENLILEDEKTVPYAARPGKYVKITVADTGSGMDEKTRERIFDPFFTTKSMGRGTGLGLATVYGIIKGHGGMIHVESEPGQGTTFMLYIPASEEEVVKEKTETGAVRGGRETILLADDEAIVLDVTRDLLESLGYHVYVAGGGQEAVAAYMEKKDEIDLVILDMIMPGMSGGETFDRLREVNPEVRILLSSGYSINGQAQDILDRGCNGFLQKPFHLEQLSGKVREILG